MANVNACTCSAVKIVHQKGELHREVVTIIPNGFILPQARLIPRTRALEQTSTVQRINKIRDTIKF